MKLTEIQEAWLQALESGKYEQGTGRLASHDGSYCCLGVFCVVLDLEKDAGLRPRFIYQSKTVSTLLTLGLYEKLGLRSNSGSFKTAMQVGGKYYSDLTSLNDGLCWPFAKIAAYIRANPENVFVESKDDASTVLSQQAC